MGKKEKSRLKRRGGAEGLFLSYCSIVAFSSSLLTPPHPSSPLLSSSFCSSSSSSSPSELLLRRRHSSLFRAQERTRPPFYVFSIFWIFVFVQPMSINQSLNSSVTHPLTPSFALHSAVYFFLPSTLYDPPPKGPALDSSQSIMSLCMPLGMPDPYLFFPFSVCLILQREAM